MTRVAVVAAFAVKADVVGWRDEKCLQQIIVGQLIDLGRNVQDPTSYGHRSSEAKQSD